MYADRTWETCSGNPGISGNFVLNGPPAGYQGFSGNIVNGNVVPYVAEDAAGTSKWETGLGTWSGGQIQRTTIFESTNGNTNVNWSGNNINVKLAPTASQFASYLTAITSGQIVSGMIGNGAVNSGNIASGQIGLPHLVSGLIVQQLSNNQVLPISGNTGVNMPVFSTQVAETVSGVCAVSYNSIGKLQVAMAGVPSRMPAVGIVTDNVASGSTAMVYAFGTTNFPTTASGNVTLGSQVWIAQSGQLCSMSGSFMSGGFASGNVQQCVGVANSTNGMHFGVVPGTAFVRCSG